MKTFRNIYNGKGTFPYSYFDFVVRPLKLDKCFVFIGKLIVFRQALVYFSPFHNSLALLHALTMLTVFMGQGEFIDKNAH